MSIFAASSTLIFFYYMMKFDFKQSSREARAARKTTGKQYRALRAVYLEGPLEITIRSGSHTVSLTPSRDTLNQFLGDVSEELRTRYLSLQQEEEEALRDYEQEVECASELPE